MSWTGYREFILHRKQTETEDVTSFYLRPKDPTEDSLPAYQPGQHLSFKFEIPGQEKPVFRFYTLSESYRPEHYRISVKREPDGLASVYLHDQLQVGDSLQVKAPKGNFHLDPAATSPVIFIAGGIGITPLFAMLEAAHQAGDPRECWFFNGIRDRAHFPFQAAIHEIADSTALQLETTVCISHEEGCDVTELAGADHVLQEMITSKLIQCSVPAAALAAADIYLCGPTSMMTDITAGLLDLGVTEARIHTESFGPASTAYAEKTAGKTAETAPENADLSDAAGSSKAMIRFTQSDLEIEWDDSFNCLWELAEANGVDIDSGCLYGDCGTCMTDLTSGEVAYNHPPAATPDEGSCLPCCCKPVGTIELDA